MVSFEIIFTITSHDSDAYHFESCTPPLLDHCPNLRHELNVQAWTGKSPIAREGGQRVAVPKFNKARREIIPTRYTLPLLWS